MANEMRDAARGALLQALAIARPDVRRGPFPQLALARLAEDLARQLKLLPADYVVAAKDAGASWQDVGDAFDITRQSAHQRFVGSVNARR